ncbi:RluA family pseudouridine synthase [Kovacikia minuta CCNUW1]|uniref:RluA family pseudouridine synthase n=1 Tax=Kovacikia minuta TaxID=2931930 RepID=UPI001CCF5AC7|nr:RluA family pseudouridine synthase [Kovacikia minuta]UBF26850.1 RluA family pseudouridine synthase [Kovacikia minuta CCNUW1]
MTISYWYEGRCPHSGELLRLPRNHGVEAIACNLMQHLASNATYSREGKMYGVLLVETPSGEQQVLQAFSGLLNGESMVAGWVPPIPGREQLALQEAHTLAMLQMIKQELIELQHSPARQEFAVQTQEFALRLQQLSVEQQQRQQERQYQRHILAETLTGAALETALEQLDEQSRRDGIARRHLKRQRQIVLQPLKDHIEQVDDRIRQLKHQRKQLSRQLQAQMHAHYSLTNFAGETLPLQALIPGGAMPTGTGDCCAPKLLHYAATQGFKPLAMAEFWWGPSPKQGDKIQGEFYGACAERCQPLMGFLLSGSYQPSAISRQPSDSIQNFPTPHTPHPTPHTLPLSLPILYEDDWLIAINKPAGMLSVPGRYRDRQDSVLTRLQHGLPDQTALLAVHRLDQETSGILLLAKDQPTHRLLSQQFQQRTVHKVYEAILAGAVRQRQGVIELPLWGDPDDRPYQKVDWQRGKPSTTRFQVISNEQNLTRIEFVPITGRTHQIRVHAADARGLGVPVLGDRLYGCCEVGDRLHLHARELRFDHPQLGKILCLQAKAPF